MFVDPRLQTGKVGPIINTLVERAMNPSSRSVLFCVCAHFSLYAVLALAFPDLDEMDFPGEVDFVLPRAVIHVV